MTRRTVAGVRLSSAAVRGTGAAAVWVLVLAAVFAAGFAVTAAVVAEGTRTPETGEVPDCAGAAALAVADCEVAMLDLAVAPTPEQARREENAPCRVIRRGVPFVCTFGAPEDRAVKRIALIGDSHASHWRAAIAPIAARERWLGFSLTRAGCPLSLAEPVLPARLLPDCLRWRSAALRWLRSRPDIDTVVVSQHRVRVRPAAGQSRLEAEIDGYVRAWRALPATVKRVVVIRDTPVNPSAATRCVTRTVARGRPPGPACTFDRRAALNVDAAVLAARRVGAPRAHVIDMTRFFCGRRDCFPVVGGTLVFRDEGHMTVRYAETLVPYLAPPLTASAAA